MTDLSWLDAVRYRDRRRYANTQHPNNQAGADVHRLLAHMDSGTTLHLSDPADSIKMVRETLCVAQSAVSQNYALNLDTRARHVQRLQRMIDECDRQRPLGSDGKHGNMHTPTCGCDDQ